MYGRTIKHQVSSAVQSGAAKAAQTRTTLQLTHRFIRLQRTQQQELNRYGVCLAIGDISRLRCDLCMQGFPGARIRCKNMSSDAAPISTETGVSVVYVTVPSEGDVAKQLAGTVINNKLAACVNILPGCLRLQT